MGEILYNTLVAEETGILFTRKMSKLNRTKDCVYNKVFLSFRFTPGEMDPDWKFLPGRWYQEGFEQYLRVINEKNSQQKQIY